MWNINDPINIPKYDFQCDDLKFVIYTKNQLNSEYVLIKICEPKQVILCSMLRLEYIYIK